VHVSFDLSNQLGLVFFQNMLNLGTTETQADGEIMEPLQGFKKVFSPHISYLFISHNSYQKILKIYSYWGFLKCWYPTTMGFSLSSPLDILPYQHWLNQPW